MLVEIKRKRTAKAAKREAYKDFLPGTARQVRCGALRGSKILAAWPDASAGHRCICQRNGGNARQLAQPDPSQPPPNRKSADTGEGPRRTLTNLYNARPTWLDLAYKCLDVAVFAAYGWPTDLSDEQILERLLALNLQRARKVIS